MARAGTNGSTRFSETEPSADDELNERLRVAAIVESSDDAIFSNSLEGVNTSWNGAAERQFGFTAAEILGNSMWILIPESRRGEESQKFERLKRGERVGSFETVRRRKDGSEVEVSVTLSLMRDQSGHSSGISTIARDISELRRSQQALLQSKDTAEAANRESSRLAAIVESSDDAIFSNSLDGVNTSWNGAAERQFGFTAPEILGNSMWILIPESRRDEESQKFEHLKRGERVGTFETVRRRKDGSEVAVSVTLSLIRDESGESTGIATIARDISELRRSQQALLRAKDAAEAASKESSRLAAIVESSDDAIFSTSLDGVNTSWNGAAERQFGFTAAEILGSSMWILVPESRRGEESQKVERLKRGERIGSFETVRRRKDGSEVAVSVTLSLILDQAGRSTGISTIARDISELRRSQEALIQSRDAAEAARKESSRLAAIVESSDDAIFSNSLDGVNTSWNGAAERQFGFTAAEILGNSMWILIPESRREEESLKLERLKKGERIGSFATVRRRKDGSEVEVSVTLSLIRDQAGESSGISTIARDISELRRSQQAALKSKDAALSATKESLRLAAIVESSDDAIFSKSLDGIITSWNWTAQRLLGYSAEEMIGTSMWHLIPESRRDEETLAFDRLKKGERIPSFETLRKRKDGTEVEVSVTLSPIKDEAGQSLGISTIARDITQMRALVLANEAAQAANKELESFSYSVAHDLRAPLRGIDGFCQALAEDCADKLDADGRKYLGFIRESAQLMAKLIDEILELSRVVRSEFRSEPTDLSALAYSAYTRLARSNPDRNVEVVVQSGLVSNGDAKLLALVFNNLIGNAWKFSSKRSDARIEFGATSKDGRLAYFVRDNGAGFDMAYASKLFGVFQRLHTAHEFEGSGVGLATVQRVVHRHGGRVWAEGAVGAGATFYFTLGEWERTV